jgi:hypothetical protein
MSRNLASMLVLALAAAVSAAAQTPQKDPAPKNSAVTMDGCVARGKAPQDPITFSQADSSIKYRLTGKSLNKYAGQRVEIVGSSPEPKRVAIRGGLYPSPNVAAQAGALDPAKAAIARQPGGSESGTGAVDLLPEFKVTRIRVLEGACE